MSILKNVKKRAASNIVNENIHEDMPKRKKDDTEEDGIDDCVNDLLNNSPQLNGRKRLKSKELNLGALKVKIVCPGPDCKKTFKSNRVLSVHSTDNKTDWTSEKPFLQNRISGFFILRDHISNMRP